MFRELINKFNRSLSEKMVPPRRNHVAPIKIWFDPDSKTEQAAEQARNRCILGETCDISRTGIGFVVPAIRYREKYLVGHELPLNVEIDLPNGKVYMRAMGCRYEKVGIHISAERFLVGARILSLTDQDKEIYETFLKNGNRGLRTATRPVEIGID